MVLNRKQFPCRAFDSIKNIYFATKVRKKKQTKFLDVQIWIRDMAVEILTLVQNTWKECYASVNRTQDIRYSNDV